MQDKGESVGSSAAALHSAKDIVHSLDAFLDVARKRQAHKDTPEPERNALSAVVWALETAARLFGRTSALESVEGVCDSLLEKADRREVAGKLFGQILGRSGDRFGNFFFSQDDWTEPHNREGYDKLHMEKSEGSDEAFENNSRASNDQGLLLTLETLSIGRPSARKQDWDWPATEEAAEVWRRTFLAGALEIAGVEEYPQGGAKEPEGLLQTDSGVTASRLLAAYERLEQLGKKGRLYPSSSPTEWTRAFDSESEPIDQLNRLSALWPIIQEIGQRVWIDGYVTGEPYDASQPPTDKELKWRSLTSLVLGVVSVRYISTADEPCAPPYWIGSHRRHTLSRNWMRKDVLRIFTEQLEDALDRFQPLDLPASDEDICNKDSEGVPQDEDAGQF